MFSGLENQCTADELVAALSTELSELGFDENKIAYIEVRPSPTRPSTSPHQRFFGQLKRAMMRCVVSARRETQTNASTARAF